MSGFFKFPENAFDVFMEDVAWQQDEAPRRRGNFRAIILQGESQSTGAGPTLSSVTADPWSVMVPLKVSIIADIKPGDTLSLISRGPNPPTLSVQQITQTEQDYVIRCTANERAPH